MLTRSSEKIVNPMRYTRPIAAAIEYVGESHQQELCTYIFVFIFFFAFPIVSILM